MRTSSSGYQDASGQEEYEFKFVPLVTSIIFITISAAMLMALVSDMCNVQIIGKFGDIVAGSLNYVFGKYFALGVPGLLLCASFFLYPRRIPKQLPLIVEGGFLSLVSMLALIAVHVAHDAPQISLTRAGAIGTFLMHKNACNLTAFIGNVGSYLIFSALLLIGMILATNSNPIKSVHSLLKKFSFTGIADWVREKFTVQDDEETFDNDEEGYEDTPKIHPVTYTAPPPPQEEFASRRLFRATAAVASNADVAPTAPTEIVGKDFVSRDEPEVLAATPTPVSGCDILPPVSNRAYIEVYDLPETSLLNKPPRIDMTANEAEAQRGANSIVTMLKEFGVNVIVTNIVMGPSVTRYEIQPAPGVKVERITALENNLTMAMEAKHLRIIAPIPGKDAIGIEVPNKNVQPVFLSELLNCESFRASTAPLAFALGKTIDGQPRILDLARMPHLLIAGTTGSGKSVCLNCVIVSMLFHMPPDRVKMIMIDPKQVELSVYRDIPHLLAPVVTHPQNAAAALSWACDEMEERLYKMSQIGVRNIDGYNSYIHAQPDTIDRPDAMPHIVVIIDELADLMLVAKKDVEDSIIRLAQKARAAGIHLILATQRPTVNVITGLIKSNFPARIAFQVASHIDSRTILDSKGAEALQGRGDMLFSVPGASKPERIQGCYVSDAEVEAVADFVRNQAKPEYNNSVLGEEDDNGGDWDNSSNNNGRSNGTARRRPTATNSAATAAMCEEDAGLYEEAIRLVLTSKQASQSMLQRRLRVGFSKAGWLMDQMENEGIVGPSQNGRVREFLVDPETFLRQRGWADDDIDDE